MRPVLKQPDPRLRARCEPVEVFDDRLAELLDELDAVMRAGPGGVGIAAPQIGVLERLIVVDCSLARHPCSHHGLLRMVNPEIVESSGKSLGREGCLSVPDWVGNVERARRITVRYRDERGEMQELQAKGFEARVLQHEIDHIDGILFVDRIVSTKDLVRRM